MPSPNESKRVRATAPRKKQTQQESKKINTYEHVEQIRAVRGFNWYRLGEPTARSLSVRLRHRKERKFPSGAHARGHCAMGREGCKSALREGRSLSVWSKAKARSFTRFWSIPFLFSIRSIQRPLHVTVSLSKPPGPRTIPVTRKSAWN